MGLDIEDRAELESYLRSTGRIGPNEPIESRVLAGGVSNRTVWVKRASGEAWVLKQALAKLRVKVDWFSDPSRIHREALALKWLPKLAPPGTITPLIFEDPEHHLLAMEAVPQPHENWKTMLLAGRTDYEYAHQFGTLLGRIHRGSFEQRDQLRQVFKDTSFFESLRIEPYYLYTSQQVPAAAKFFTQLVEETRALRLALVHGDYSPKNVLIRDDRVVLLDHEVIHWGDPGFDLGFAMTHFLSKGHHFPARRRDFLKLAINFWASYQDAVGDDSWVAQYEERAVRHMLGCLLARVAGRSPLEYLDEAERARQRDVVLELILHSNRYITDTASDFRLALDPNDTNRAA